MKILSAAAVLFALWSCVASAAAPPPSQSALRADNQPQQQNEPDREAATVYTNKQQRYTRRRLRQIDWLDIYHAAVADSATTYTTHSKCRDRETNEVIVIGAKAPKSSKSSKSSKASKTPRASRAPGPAPAPTPVIGNISTKAPKSDSRRGIDRLTVNDLTRTSKASKSSGKYDDADIPYCDEIYPGTTQGDSTCSDIKSGSYTISNVVDRFELYVTVGGTDINRSMNQGLQGIVQTQIRIALAKLSGCTSGQLSRRRRRLSESVFTMDGLSSLDMGLSSYSACDSNGSTCAQMYSEILVGNQEDEELYRQMRQYEPEILEQLQRVFGDDIRFILLSVTRRPSQPGDGDDGDDNDGVTGIVAPESSVEDDRGLQAGGYVGLAGAFLVLIFLLLFCIKRRRNQDKSFYTDEENSHERYFDDDSSVSDLPPDRLAHVVGEENSQYTGTSWGNKSRIRIQPIDTVQEDTLADSVEITQEGPTPDDERLDEIRRQVGSSARLVSSEVHDPSAYTERDYMASDTVDL